MPAVALIENIAYLPSGSLVDFAGTSAPAGWLMCDGSAVSRTTYADLFLAIGTAYGSGDGSTTFNLPDFRGRFARYNDNMGTGAAGRDTGRVHGSSQTDAMQGHLHDKPAGQSGFAAFGSGGAAIGGGSGVASSANTGAAVADGTNGTPRTAAETRPINLSANKIIKV